MKVLKIGYFADGPWSHVALEKLFADETLKVAFICARYSNPDQKLKDRAKVLGIEYLTHPQVNSQEFIERIAKFECELFVSMSFNQIFKKEIISLPDRGIINCHAGKLPYYRGRNVLNWVLINDESEFGITVHYVDEGIDSGPIIMQRIFGITDMDDYSTLLNRAYVECGNILYDSIKLLQKNQVVLRNQLDTHQIGTYCVQRKEGDEVLNWYQKSRDIFNFVRAICAPGPQARTKLDGKEIKINKVEIIMGAPEYVGVPGSIIGRTNNSFTVKTLDSSIKVTKWSGCNLPNIGDRFL
jgi:methionyl-tRNA formyltransferase